MTLVGFRAQNHRQQVGKRGALEKVDDRRTPDEIFLPLEEEFGFTLDAAASRENAKCDHFYTIEDNGLAQPWAWHRVWCNPPYSDCAAWVEKAHLEFSFGRSKLIVMLLPANRTEQKWWQDWIEPFRRKGLIETRFLPGRPRFDVPEGTYSDPRGNRPPFGVVLVIWRRR